MAKVAIKNENITSFGGIYHIMDAFSKLGFEKLTESVLGKRASNGKAFSYGSIFGSLFFSYLCVKNVQKISMRLQDSSTRVLAHCSLVLTLPILNIYRDFTMNIKQARRTSTYKKIDFVSSNLPFSFID